MKHLWEARKGNRVGEVVTAKALGLEWKNRWNKLVWTRCYVCGEMHWHNWYDKSEKYSCAKCYSPELVPRGFSRGL